MSTGTPEAARNHSRSKLANRAAPSLVAALRTVLVLAGFAGAVLVALTTFTTIIEITIGGGGSATADFDPDLTGYDRHSVALLLIGALAAVLHAGAARGARPAMLAVTACGIAVLLIAVLGDAPDLDQAGRVAELYEDTSAQAGIGFYLETLGGALLAIAGVGLLVLGGGAAELGGVTRARAEAPTRDEGDGAPATERRSAEVPAAAAAVDPEPVAGAPSATAGPSPVRRFGSGLAAGAAKARRAREEQQARHAERAEAGRVREQARAERAAKERAEAAAREAERERVEAQRADEARRAEAQRADEARRAEAERGVEGERQAAATHAAADARASVEARAAADARAIEDARAAAEARAVEKARATEEARATEAAAAETAAPGEPGTGGGLSFDERLRQARERARRSRP